jgi:hypothetical protein
MTGMTTSTLELSLPGMRKPETRSLNAAASSTVSKLTKAKPLFWPDLCLHGR